LWRYKLNEVCDKLVGKLMGRSAVLEIVLFNKPSNKQRATRGVVNFFK